MPNQIIAVDDELSNVRQALEAEGYQVVGVRGSERPDVCVITGMDQDIAGIENILKDVPVIDAAGMSAEEIVKEVSRRATARA